MSELSVSIQCTCPVRLATSSYIDAVPPDHRPAAVPQADEMHLADAPHQRGVQHPAIAPLVGIAGFGVVWWLAQFPRRGQDRLLQSLTRGEVTVAPVLAAMHHRPADELRLVEWLQPGHLDAQGLAGLGKQQVGPQAPCVSARSSGQAPRSCNTEAIRSLADSIMSSGNAAGRGPVHRPYDRQIRIHYAAPIRGLALACVSWHGRTPPGRH